MRFSLLGEFDCGHYLMRIMELTLLGVCSAYRSDHESAQVAASVDTELRASERVCRLSIDTIALKRMQSKFVRE